MILVKEIRFYFYSFRLTSSYFSDLYPQLGFVKIKMKEIFLSKISYANRVHPPHHLEEEEERKMGK